MHASGATSDPNTADNQTFNYIIVRGGLCGLTVAGCLTEDALKTVLVIEAGNDDCRDPFNVLQYGAVFGTDPAREWNTDQDRVILGGRTLGGDSSINGTIITRGMKE
ncbi:uncharacterized protein FOMMEDRAFT_160543 [Fomitiporia mediterranea MF3/22]|uniref:uncharacterized protein n=1 Tax=Fomitiporia mediterranea (strain MF3/22) TaxID=694068 RepID=UPI000440899D|nr:uncharacterized protein FOMMEDRAFT_160543 [Fomitiporia mediterranea MF3/22]EJC99485.1 hypothetical protein FOMMEDRAFT_160543 [Fomitiporia mediterranea MF3/22]